MLDSTKLDPIKEALKELYKVGLEPQNEGGVPLGATSNEIDQMAKEFADNVYGPLKNEIDNYIKCIMIMMTIPPTMISPVVPPLPGGPCSGTANLDIS